MSCHNLKYKHGTKCSKDVKNTVKLFNYRYYDDNIKT